MKHSSQQTTYNDPEIVAGDDGISILHPFDGWSGRAADLAFKHDVRGFVSVYVGGFLQELWGS